MASGQEDAAALSSPEGERCSSPPFDALICEEGSSHHPPLDDVVDTVLEAVPESVPAPTEGTEDNVPASGFPLPGLPASSR
jgi:hypothetical protein